MASPNQIKHRVNRRKLGRGQYPTIGTFSVVVTSTGTTNITLTFSRPVSLKGQVGITVTGKTVSTQVQTSPTTCTLVASGNVTGLAYSLPAGDPNVSTYQGGQLVGIAGTFP